MEKSISQSNYPQLLTIEPYVRVVPQVFAILAMHGFDASEVGAFFVETADKVRQCEPNYKFFGEVKDNVWILRDTYPGTDIVFKMTLVYQTAAAFCKHAGIEEDISDYNDRIWVNVKIVPPKLHGRINVPYKEAQKYLMAKAANILIGDNIKPEEFMKYKFTAPKRMFPKGYKFEDRPRKRRPHIHNKRTRSKKDVSSASS